MKLKKFIALGMAGLLTMSCATVALAADVTDPSAATGNVTGEGDLEGYVDKNVFTVTLPTVTTVQFVLDPQELILATLPESSAPELDGAAFATGYADKILFKDGTNYKTKSSDITVVNKSTFDVDVTIGAKITGLTKTGDGGYDVKVVASDADFGSDTAISMALTPSTNTLTGTTEGTPTAGTPVALDGTDAGITTVSKVAVSTDVDNAYEVTKSGDAYSYSMKADVSGVAFNEVTFNLSGKLNKTADWTNFNKDTTAKLSVGITYSVAKHVDNAAPTFTAGTGRGTIDYTKGAGNDGLASIKSITMVTPGGGVVDGYKGSTQYGWEDVTDTGSTLTLHPTYLDFYTSLGDTHEATITYLTNGGETKTVKVAAVVIKETE